MKSINLACCVETLNSAPYGVVLELLELIAMVIPTIALRKIYSLSLILFYRKTFQILLSLTFEHISGYSLFPFLKIASHSSRLCIREIVETMLNVRLRYRTKRKGIITTADFVTNAPIDCVTTLVSDRNQASLDWHHLNAVFLNIRSAFRSVSLPILKQTIINLNIPLNFSSFILKLMSP